MVYKSKQSIFDNRILEEKALWGIDDLMEFTTLARQTIYNKVSKNEIPHRKKFGKLYFIPEEIINLIEEGD